MATRKCGNIHFPKKIMAVFHDDFFPRIIWVGGVKKFLKKFFRCTIENLEPSLTIQELKK